MPLFRPVLAFLSMTSAIGGLALPVAAQQGPEPAPQRIVVEKPDVRRNVMRLLEQARVANEPLTDSAASEALPPPEPAAAAQARPRPPVTGISQDWFDGPLQGYRSPVPSAAEGYVPVPHKTITVRDLEDLQQVTSEFEEARRRKAAGAETAPVNR